MRTHSDKNKTSNSNKTPANKPFFSGKNENKNSFLNSDSENDKPTSFFDQSAKTQNPSGKNTENNDEIDFVFDDKYKTYKGNYNNSGLFIKSKNGEPVENSSVRNFIKAKKREGDERFINAFPSKLTDEDGVGIYTIENSVHTHYKFDDDPDYGEKEEPEYKGIEINLSSNVEIGVKLSIKIYSAKDEWMEYTFAKEYPQSTAKDESPQEYSIKKDIDQNKEEKKASKDPEKSWLWKLGEYLDDLAIPGGGGGFTLVSENAEGFNQAGRKSKTGEGLEPEVDVTILEAIVNSAGKSKIRPQFLSGKSATPENIYKDAKQIADYSTNLIENPNQNDYSKKKTNPKILQNSASPNETIKSQLELKKKEIGTLIHSKPEVKVFKDGEIDVYSKIDGSGMRGTIMYTMRIDNKYWGYTYVHDGNKKPEENFYELFPINFSGEIVFSGGGKSRILTKAEFLEETRLFEKKEKKEKKKVDNSKNKTTKRKKKKETKTNYSSIGGIKETSPKEKEVIESKNQVTSSAKEDVSLDNIQLVKDIYGYLEEGINTIEEVHELIQNQKLKFSKEEIEEAYLIAKQLLIRKGKIKKSTYSDEEIIMKILSKEYFINERTGWLNSTKAKEGRDPNLQRIFRKEGFEYFNAQNPGNEIPTIYYINFDMEHVIPYKIPENIDVEKDFWHIQEFIDEIGFDKWDLKNSLPLPTESFKTLPDSVKNNELKYFKNASIHGKATDQYNEFLFAKISVLSKSYDDNLINKAQALEELEITISEIKRALIKGEVSILTPGLGK